MKIFLVVFFVCIHSLAWSQIYGSKEEDSEMLRLDLSKRFYWGDENRGMYYGYLDSIGPNLYLMKPKYNLDSLPISFSLGNKCDKCTTKIILNYAHNSDEMCKYFKETSKMVINDTVFLSLKSDTVHYSGEIRKLYLTHNTTNDFKSADLYFDKDYESITIDFFVRRNYFWYWMPEYKVNVKRNKVILSWSEGQFSLKKLNQREIKQVLKRIQGTARINLNWVLTFDVVTEQHKY